MAELAALRSALYLFHMPSAVRQARGRPLPEGMSVLLEIAAGEGEVSDFAARSLERPPQVLSDAAGYFIEQILLAPESDSYRVLGATRDITNADLRRNMALLLRWAHPDADRLGSQRAAFANRITKAWENLKSQERRERYDATHPVRSGGSGGGSLARPGDGRSARSPAAQGAARMHCGSGVQTGRPGIVRRAFAFLFRGK
jgi:hypothetical protein